MIRQRIDASKLDLKEHVININRVTKVVKGGRNFRFAALVVVGDENGHVGVGTGKAQEVPEAIRKAIEDAKKRLIFVPRVGTTTPHPIKGIYGAGSVLKDVRAKSLGTNNSRNMVNATLEGLKSLKTVESVAKARGKTVEELLG